MERSNSVTQARDAQRAHDVADVFKQAGDTPSYDEFLTTADILLALSKAWKAGHRAGFDEGFERGQKAAASAIEAVQGAMQR